MHMLKLFYLDLRNLVIGKLPRRWGGGGGGGGVLSMEIG